MLACQTHEDHAAFSGRRHRRAVSAMLLAAMVCGASAQNDDQDALEKTIGKRESAGRNWALIIGIDGYAQAPLRCRFPGDGGPNGSRWTRSRQRRRQRRDSSDQTKRTKQRALLNQGNRIGT